MSDLPAPAECANCGTEIPRGARACPECGADERTGWREQNIYDGLDLPEEESTEKPVTSGMSTGWKLTGVVLLVIFVVLILRGLW